MIYLIHGQNQVDSRRFLIRLKNSYQDLQSIPGEGLTEKGFKENIAGISHPLFGGKTAVLIEKFDGSWKIFPKKLPEGIDLILWSGEKINVSNLPVKNFLFHKTQKATSFKLADAVLFRNEKEALVLAIKLLSAREPVEKIISAISRGFFLAYAAKEESLSKTNLPTFAQERIEEQAKLWDKATLKKALLHLLSLDLALKEGTKPNLGLTSFISRAVSL